MNPYFLATTQRTGSHLLMNLLNSTGVAGTVSEKLAHRLFERETLSDDEIVAFIDKEVKSKSARTANGVWGTKVNATELAEVERYYLLKGCPSLKWIYLKRRDKLKQALSDIKARKTGVWHFTPETSDSDRERVMNDGEPSKERLAIYALGFYVMEKMWDDFFAKYGITPCVIYYEDFMNPADWERTVMDVLLHLGIVFYPPVCEEVHFERTSTDAVPAVYAELRHELGAIGAEMEKC